MQSGGHRGLRGDRQLSIVLLDAGRDEVIEGWVPSKDRRLPPPRLDFQEDLLEQNDQRFDVDPPIAGFPACGTQRTMKLPIGSRACDVALDRDPQLRSRRGRERDRALWSRLVGPRRELWLHR